MAILQVLVTAIYDIHIYLRDQNSIEYFEHFKPASTAGKALASHCFQGSHKLTEADSVKKTAKVTVPADEEKKGKKYKGV